MASLNWEELCGNSSAFWDQQLTWNTTNPDFTECFHKTVLVWLPCSILWLFLPLHVYHLRHSKARHIPWSPLNITKLIITTVLLLLWTVKLSVVISYYTRGEHFLFIDFITPFIMVATFLLAWIVIYCERKQGIQSSVLLFFFWLCLSVTGAFTFRSFIMKTWHKLSREDEIHYSIYMVYYPLVVSQLILSVFNDHEPLYRNSEYVEENACPKNTASFISRLLFAWFDRLLWIGYRNNLEAGDVWKASPEVTTKHSVPELLKYWKKPSPSDKPPTLQSIIWKSQWPVFLKIFIIRLFGDIFIYTNPLILNQILSFVSSNEPFWHGYVYIIGMLLGSFAESLICWHASFYGQTSCVTIQSAFISMVYRKTLTFCSAARQSSTSGEIVNHMAIDIDHVTGFIHDASYQASFPLQIAIGITMLYNLLGAAAFAGLGTMILLKFVSGYVAHQMEKIEEQQLKLKDQRIKQINEAILGIKVLKLFAWEKPFMRRIGDVRLKETQTLRRKLLFGGGVTLLWTVSSSIVGLVTFTTYLMMDSNNVFDASKAFVTITIVDILSIPMMQIPMILAEFVQAYVSVGRLNKFMASKDLDPNSVIHDNSSDYAIAVKSATFSWSTDQEPILRNIDFEVLEGHLVAVVGPVGCGKSSLISGILGEMEKVCGTVCSKGRIAYIPQQAWILNATLKNNVLFGRAFQEEFYNEVIKACALEPDLAILPGGDETEIGEKGVNLSGGQKQRVSLARAVYNSADVYLLDDPLSAVDAHVGEHLFNRIVGPKGLLKNKTRILVTHSITYLPYVDNIVVLSNGSISESGTYDELVQRNGAFAEFLATYGQSNSSHVANFTRSESVQSKTTVDDDEIQNGARLTTTEHLEHGEVNKSVYALYIKYVGVFASIGILLLLAVGVAFSAAAHVWLSIWSADPVSHDTKLRNIRLAVYAALGFAYGLVLFLGIFALVFAAMKASIGFHSKLLYSVLRCPMSFFDTTPSGRIVNRFSKDIDTVDSVLPSSFLDVLVCTLEIVAAVVVICINLPFLLLAILPISVIYFLVQKFFVRTADQLRRIESATRSPIFSRFSETLAGTSTVRAYQRQNEFVKQFDELVDAYLKNVYYVKVLFRWIGLRLDLLGNFLIIFTTLFAIHQRDSMSASTIALIISYASSINFTFCWLVHNIGLLESNIVSVERLHEYICLKSEASWEDPDNKPSSLWPSTGKLEFRNFTTKYREELTPVLHGLTCEINDGEKIGIVGRTGAGKSSITLSLFRIIEGIEGAIIVDGIDIATIGLHDLRNCLTIIPQEPVLFSGALRINLDPFNQHSDDELWRALELSHLKEHVSSLTAGLLHEVSEGGENLSVGQRQLLCLARALLRKSKILILDEATAAVDLETDDLIQDTIRREFADCTILTIAHRINTIMDSARVIVLDAGVIKEFDSPSALLNDRKSLFYSMAKSAGLQQ